MELVTLKHRLQNLGALDKEAPDIGGFFLIHRYLFDSRRGLAQMALR
jgi:hypothetical protein